MRRPTSCSAFEEQKCSPIPSSSDKESRLSKVKRMITGSLLLGRKSKKDNANQESSQYQENTQIFYENEDFELCGLQNSKIRNDENKEQFQKCKKDFHTKLIKKSISNDEEMDTENIPSLSKKEISICLTKENGSSKKVKEICIEITKNQACSTVVLKPRKRKERLDSGGSIKHENKVIRSNSEERHEEKSNDINENIRRVSSHEDFSRVKKHIIKPLHEVNTLQDTASSSIPEQTTTNHDDSIDVKKKNSSESDSSLKENEFRIEDVFMNACPEEIEHERRRSCERFARACATPRGHRNVPRRRVKGHKTSGRSEMDIKMPKSELHKHQANNLDLPDRKDRSPSPGPSSSPPALDLTSLHRQMEGSEPITSRGKISSPNEELSPSLEALISPRNSLVMRLDSLDSSIPPSPSHDYNLRQVELDSRERKLGKQIRSIKKKLKRYEDGFEEEFGYRPSHADKMANKDIKKMCSELSKLKIQMKELKEENSTTPPLYSEPGKALCFLTSLEVQATLSTIPGPKNHNKGNKSMEEVLQEVEKKLEEKRQINGRTNDMIKMNRGELLEEKLAVQKALLHLENVFGRPVTKEDRDLVRPLYQRYRTLKRMVIRNTAAKLNNSTGELATILEHETMDFSNSPSTSFDLGDATFSAPEGLNNPNQIMELMENLPKTLLEVPACDDLPNSSSSSESLGENLHALPLSQLLEQQTNAREEKKKLRRNLREFEENFQTETGRRALKQDRVAIEGIYVNYKQVKAKLRLLDALIAKKTCQKRNSC